MQVSLVLLVSFTLRIGCRSSEAESLPGVGAVFYTQVALEVLPEDGTRTALRDVLIPINYFLVLTSIIVHGITIPIGKGFQQARSLTITRSQAGLTAADRVSRLPAPLPLGSEALREQAERELGRSQSGTVTDNDENGASTAIRFDLESDRKLETPLPVHRRTGILSQTNTPPLSPVSSRPGTPTPQEKSVCERLPLPGSVGRLPRTGGPKDDRETAEQRTRGEVWVEGENVVAESDDGETVRVMSREEYESTRGRDEV